MLEANEIGTRQPFFTPESRGFALPKTTVETILAQIWCQILEISHVDIHSHFFDELGGDALRCLQIRALAQERGICFSLQQFLLYPTISELAQEASVVVALPPQQELYAFNRTA